MLDARRLQILRAVVTGGSVTTAAANLGYTPSAISQQIAALERQAGVPLLERAGRGVRATAAGLLLSEHAEVIGRRLAEAETALADLRDGLHSRLKVRYFASAGATLVPPAVARVRRAHPGVAIDLSIGGDAGTDLEIAVDPVERNGFRVLPVLDDPYRAVLPPGHRLARKRVLDLAELAGEAWVIGEWPSGPCLKILLDACAAAGFTPAVAVRSEDYATAQGFVAAGLGVSAIPATGLSGLTGRHPEVVVRKLRRPEPVRAIRARVSEAALNQPAMRTLLTALGVRDVPR